MKWVEVWRSGGMAGQGTPLEVRQVKRQDKTTGTSLETGVISLGDVLSIKSCASI